MAIGYKYDFDFAITIITIMTSEPTTLVIIENGNMSYD